MRVSQSLPSVLTAGSLWSFVSFAVQFLLQTLVSRGFFCGNSLRPGLIVRIFKDLHLLLVTPVDNASWGQLKVVCCLFFLTTQVAGI